MTYTALAVFAVLIVVAFDYFVARTRLVTRRIFWVSYVIILFFQLVANGLFTGLTIVRYRDQAILGSGSPGDELPAAVGDGRLLFAPIEDVFFGFAMILLTLSLWVVWGRLGVDREVASGPARFPPGLRRDQESSAQRDSGPT